jgi:hypothetical protein
MSQNDLNQTTDRRSFLGSLAAGATTVGIATMVAPIAVHAKPGDNPDKDPHPAEVWLNKLKGTHRVVFDVTKPHEIFPFAWPRIYLMTNGVTGAPESDCGVIVILRHDAIPYAMEDRLWEKYKFGEMFHAHDPATKEASLRNPFWKPKEGAFSVPGFGVIPIGINELQASGVMFGVCDAALTVYSAAAAQKLGKDAAEIKKDWVAGLLPGIQPVPSGVWAVGRAQEKGCAYIFAS